MSDERIRCPVCNKKFDPMPSGRRDSRRMRVCSRSCNQQKYRSRFKKRKPGKPLPRDAERPRAEGDAGPEP